jgi:broad specificity phosphatase PhoE
VTARVIPTSTALACVYLVRHGETAWSLSGQHTGRTDLSLTERGKRESRTLGERLRAITFTRVLTSPLLRARQTCELVGLGDVMDVDPDLTEWDYGDYEGLLLVDIHRDRPGWSLFRDGCPHGEMPAQVCRRADRIIARLRTMQGNIAVCSHGHFGRVLAARWIGLGVTEARLFLLGTATLSVLGYEHDRADQSAIILWNAASNDLPDPAPDRSSADARTVTPGAIARWDNEGGEVPHSRQGSAT